MEDLKTERLKFLQETIEFFNLTNRCVGPDNGNNGCLYFKEGTEGCAIGRKIEDKELCKIFDAYPNGAPVGGKVFALLPLELQKYGPDFLDHIQNLHDDERNWDNQGLSKFGENKVLYIKEYHKLN